MIILSLLVSIALVLHVVESSFPALVFIASGLRLGLANIITVVMIYKFSAKETLTVLMIRILLSSMFGGGFSVFLYSFSGGLLSFTVMYILYRFKTFKLSVSGISMFGSIFFNIGQLLVASFMIKNLFIMSYLPVMGFASVITGFFVGMAAEYLIDRKSLWKYLE